MSHDNWCEPIVTQGVLGWGNRKIGLEAYGPGGRWNGQGDYANDGDLLGEALGRVGGSEGMGLVVVAVDRFATNPGILESLAEAVAETVRAWHEENNPGPGDA
jgi:hypothetical protein